MTSRLNATPFWSDFFYQATPQPAYIIILQHVSMSKLKLLKELLHYNPSQTGNLSNELSHLSLSISICIFLSTLLSAVPTPRHHLNNLPSLQFIVRQDDSNQALGLAPHVRSGLAVLQSRVWLMCLGEIRPGTLMSILNHLQSRNVITEVIVASNSIAVRFRESTVADFFKLI